MLLLTGGAGFIGSALLRQLLAAPEREVLTVDNLGYAGHLASLGPELLEHPRHRLQVADIRDLAAMRELFAEVRPSAVLHLAAQSHVDRSLEDPGAFIDSNVVGSCNLLIAALEHWRRLPPAAQRAFRFVQVSTDEVFGHLAPQAPPFDRHSAYAPRSPYAASKAAADHLAMAWHHSYGLPVLLSHCGNNYGPRQHPEKLIPLMTLNAVAGEPLPVYGDGGQLRDWLHVDDHARALERVLAAGRPGRRYLIGAREQRRNIDVVRLLCRLLDELRADSPHCPHEQLIHFVADRPGHDLRYAIDPTLAEAETRLARPAGFRAGPARHAALVLGQRCLAGGGAGARQPPPPRLAARALAAMKGILLAGGSGTRLMPMTQVLSKQLLPVYDKPMIYYPLSLLMLMGVRDVLVISAPDACPLFEQLLGTGDAWGLRLRYAVQQHPEGIAQALLIGGEFLGGDGCCLILGDNLLFGHGLEAELRAAAEPLCGATVFACPVRDPQRYGVVHFDAGGTVLGIEEKPRHPRSPYAVPGIYFYDGEAVGHAAKLRRSARGEYEITDLNRAYLSCGELRVRRFGEGIHWFDVGTPDALLEASNFVQAVARRQGLVIGYPEVLAWRQGWIDDAALAALAESVGGDYGLRLRELAAGLGR